MCVMSCADNRTSTSLVTMSSHYCLLREGIPTPKLVTTVGPHPSHPTVTAVTGPMTRSMCPQVACCQTRRGSSKPPSHGWQQESRPLLPWSSRGPQERDVTRVNGCARARGRTWMGTKTSVTGAGFPIGGIPSDCMSWPRLPPADLSA